MSKTFLRAHQIGDTIRYKGLDHTIKRPIMSVDMTTGITLYSDSTVVTGCGSVLSLEKREVRTGVPSCVACLAARTK